MNFYSFFKHISLISHLKLINIYSNILSKKNLKINKKVYKQYIILIKQYRYLGILAIKKNKFIKIK